MTRPPPDKPPKPAPADPSGSAVAPADADGAGRRRLLIRIASGAVVLVLIVTLGVLVLSGHDTPRSTEAYCSRMADTRDLGDVLAVGDATQIVAAVHQLESAGKVAPADIEAAMNLYVDYAAQLSDAVATAGKDEASIKAALQSALVAQNARADDVAAAVIQVQGYVTANCGFDLTQTTGTSR